MTNSLRRYGFHVALGGSMLIAFAACAGRPLEHGALVRNGGTASEATARPTAGGHNEGPLGMQAPISRSFLYEELAARGVHPEAVGPLNEISDRATLLAVMSTFTRALGVKCDFCHMPDNFAAATPRKAVTAYMWDQFVSKLEFRDGSAVYCDSCHHATTVFLRRSLGNRTALTGYMDHEYVAQLQRRDGKVHGCQTCHGEALNFRMLPRLDEPAGYHAPPPEPGPQE